MRRTSPLWSKAEIRPCYRQVRTWTARVFHPYDRQLQTDELVVVSVQRFLNDRSKLATRLRAFRLTARQISSALDTAHLLAGMLASNTGADKGVIADLIERVIVSSEN